MSKLQVSRFRELQQVHDVQELMGNDRPCVLRGGANLDLTLYRLTILATSNSEDLYMNTAVSKARRVWDAGGRSGAAGGQ